ncbi:MAG: glutamyl-tRNA reductase [Acidobacteria bacterium]|nr:MAG: glutamyl-tRNA reductase [Acidobacteriota bacterium]
MIVGAGTSPLPEVNADYRGQGQALPLQIKKMSIVLAGVSHKTAPVEVRECLAFTPEACAEGLRALVDGEVVREGLIVSTCNRVEVIADVDPAREEEGKERINNFLTGARAQHHGDLSKHLYTHTNKEAAHHIFRVAASLDSMVIGEPQILGQIRKAYTSAVETGTAGRVLHRLMHQAFHVAKRVRNETAISSAAVSISYTAVELGRKIFDTLEGRTVLLIGAGEMAELSARHLKKAGVSRILIANRTVETARKLASEFNGEVVAYDNLATHLASADVVICSTGATDYIITPAMAREAVALRRRNPLFLIDISVPRNVDPAVGKIKNLFLFDVDDLEAVIASNITEREREAARAERIVEAEVDRFEKSLRELDLGQEIGAMKRKLEEIAQTELARQRRRLGDLTPEQERAIEALLISTVNKISHPVIQQMRRSAESEQSDIASIWVEAFATA